MLFRKLAPAIAALALSACATVPDPGPAPTPVSQAATSPVEVGIIAINDFHGALEPPRLSVFAPAQPGDSVIVKDTTPVPAGGAAWLASAIDSIRAKYPNHVTVSAGDLISGSQFASSLYLDEPAIGVMNRIGLDFNAVGNHEFDRGRKELLRIQNGGCEKNTDRQPCQLEKFTGANFPFLAANTITETGASLFPATGTKSFGSGARKVTVGFVGVTLTGTKALVPPDAITGITFADEADTINAAVANLKQQGSDAVIVLIHQGGRTTGIPDPQGCEGFYDELSPIVARLDPRVDVVVSGHTHWAYVCELAEPGRSSKLLVTSAGVYGQLVTDITLAIDPVTRSVVTKNAQNVIVQSEPYQASTGRSEINPRFPRFAPRPDIAAYVERYVGAAKESSDKVSGYLSAQVSRALTGTASREGGTLGNLIADAQMAGARSAGAQIAFMNPFGIRAPARLDPAADGALTFGTLYQVQPFGNRLITQTFTGAQIKAILEQGFAEEFPLQALAPSAGFTYSYDLSQPIGNRVSAIALDGKPLDPEASYRVTTNNFLAEGGDGFSLMRLGTGRVQTGSDMAALQDWLAGPTPRAAPLESRVSEISPSD